MNDLKAYVELAKKKNAEELIVHRIYSRKVLTLQRELLTSTHDPDYPEKLRQYQKDIQAAIVERDAEIARINEKYPRIWL